MADEKIVVEYAVRMWNGYLSTWFWLGKGSPFGGWDSKQNRISFSSRSAAITAWEQRSNKEGGDKYKLVRITRKVKPKKYYVVSGPYDKKVCEGLVSCCSINVPLALTEWRVEERPC